MDPDRELLWLKRLRDLSHKLVLEHHTPLLLEMAMRSAIELTDAERGFLVRLEDPEAGSRIRVDVALGFDGTTLRGAEGKVSRSVVDRVLDEDRSVVTSKEEDEDLIDASSVRARRVRSIICVPMRLRGRTVGAIYLDHRFDRQAFSEDDLPCLEAFADHAALALESAQLLEDQEAHSEQLGAALSEIQKLKTSDVERPRQGLPDPSSIRRFGLMVGGSPAMRDLYRLIDRAARAGSPVLITGESGTGKDLVAREVHDRGQRATGSFVAFSCSAVPEGRLELELFGHQKGAFSGAEMARDGIFVQAGRGTVYLDQIEDMSTVMQGRLLRLLQDRQVRPVGGEALRPINCQIVASSRTDLPALVESQRFRSDLYYRLDVLRITVPPLRDRLEDVPALMANFLRRDCEREVTMTPEAVQQLASHAWPGNVRELLNEAQRLLSLEVSHLTREHLSPEIVAATYEEPASTPKTLAATRLELIRAALAETQGNRTQAARRLGIPRSTFYKLLDRYDIS